MLTKMIEEPDCVVYGFGPTRVAVHGTCNGVNWAVNRDEPESFYKIEDVVPTDVCSVRMPIPSNMNARMATSEEFESIFTSSRATFYGGVYADGCCLPHRCALGITSADCPTIVMYGGTRFVAAAHAARDSLINREWLMHGYPGARPAEGIIQNMLILARAAGIQPSDLSLGVFGGIREGFTHHPEHEIHGEYNRALIAYCRTFGMPSKSAVRDASCGEIDLYRLIRGIAVREGISSQNIFFDEIDTRNDVTPLGEPRWASHSRDPSGKRNLVLVSHI